MDEILGQKGLRFLRASLGRIADVLGLCRPDAHFGNAHAPNPAWQVRSLGGSGFRV